MVRPTFVPLNAAMDQDIATVVNRAKKVITLALDKAVAHSIDPRKFPITKGTLEHTLLQRLTRLPTANLKRGETKATFLKERKRRIANAQRRWKERYSLAGRMKANAPRTASYFGPLTPTIRLDSKRPITEQLPTKYWFGGSPRFLERMEQLLNPVNPTLPSSNDAYTWLAELLGTLPPGPTSSPPKTKLEVLIKEVTCIDETDGFCYTEAGADEIRLGGMKVDPCAVVTKIASEHIKDFKKDGDKRSYPPPSYKLFADFSLLDQGAWPRAFFATFVLAETDMGGFGQFLSSLVDQVRMNLAVELAKAFGTTVTSILVVAVPGVVAAAIVVALMVIVFIIVLAIFEEIKKWWEDDVFDPQTVMITIDSLEASREIDWVASDVWGSLNFIGHGGHYNIRYSWRCT